MAFLSCTKESKFPLQHSAVNARGQVQGSPTQTGPSWRRRGPFRETDQLILTRKTWLAPRNLIYSLSRVTQQSHIRPLHFLCWLSFLRPWGCQDHGICVCVCAVDTKGGDLIRHERRLVNPVSTGVNWRVHKAESCLLTVMRVKFICCAAAGTEINPVLGFSYFLSHWSNH